MLVLSQILRAMNVPYATLRKERQVIDQIRDKVNRQDIQDEVDMGEIPWQDVETHDLYHRLAHNAKHHQYLFVDAAMQEVIVVC